MSADMYSTNPTVFGSALIVAAPFAERFMAAGATETSAPYWMVGVGVLLVCLALGITGGVGGMAGTMRVCSTTGALACAFAAWRFWPPDIDHSLAVICAAAAAALLLWGWGQPWLADRASPPAKER